jgi:hypothetical protein
VSKASKVSKVSNGTSDSEECVKGGKGKKIFCQRSIFFFQHFCSLRMARTVILSVLAMAIIAVSLAEDYSG